eukprot:3941905-Rhodomonas_salina.2
MVYGAMRFIRGVRYCYAECGTAMGYAATRRRYAVSRTVIAYAATRVVRVVLSEAMMLRVGDIPSLPGDLKTEIEQVCSYAMLLQIVAYAPAQYGV